MEHAVKHEKSTPAGHASHHDPEARADVRPNAVLQLQQQAGNQAVQELLRARLIQAKLTVSQPGDPEEQEADAVADRIMRSHAGAAAAVSSCSCSNDEEMCEECRQKQSSTMMRKSAGAESATVAPRKGIGHILRSPGQPLGLATRAFFEPRFGRDFSDVRVHTDSESAKSAAAVDARAYTAGKNVVFAEGQYSPNSSDGVRLLAHELVHTVQQSGDGRIDEAEADKETGSHGFHRQNIVQEDQGDTSSSFGSGLSVSHRSVNSTGASLQRAPLRTGYRVEHSRGTPDSYADFLNAIQDIRWAVENVNPAIQQNAIWGVQMGKSLSRYHQDLLLSVISAVTTALSPGNSKAGLSFWEEIEGNVWSEVGKARPFVEDTEVNRIQNDLNFISDRLRQAAYAEAHQEKLAESDLPAPDIGLQEARFEQEQEDLKELNEKLKELGGLTGLAIAEEVYNDVRKDPGIGKEIFELFMLPGTIEEKLKEGEKFGILDATQLVIKIVAAKNTVITVTFMVLKKYAKRQALKAFEATATELAKHWGELAEGYGEVIEQLEVVGKVVAVADLALEAILTFKEAWNHNWDAMLSHAVKAGIAIAGVAAGGIGTAAATLLFGAIWVELGAIHMAADIIRYCRDEMVREAAGGFIDKCVQAADWARSLVADVEALYDPSNETIQDLISERLQKYVEPMKYWFGIIYNETATNDVHSLGHYPNLVSALGPEAIRALSPFAMDDPLSMAERIRDVFAGANAMAMYVKIYYPTDEEARKAEGAVNIDFPIEHEEVSVRSAYASHEDAPPPPKSKYLPKH